MSSLSRILSIPPFRSRRAGGEGSANVDHRTVRGERHYPSVAARTRVVSDLLRPLARNLMAFWIAAASLLACAPQAPAQSPSPSPSGQFTPYYLLYGTGQGACTGSVTDVNGPTCAVSQVAVTGDSTSAPSNAVVSGLTVDHSFGGSTATGSFVGAEVTLNQTGTTGNMDNGNYVGGLFVVQGNLPDNGTPSQPSGSLWGIDANVRLSNQATNWNQLIAEELDIAALSGTSVADKIGLQIVQPSNDGAKGSRSNLGISINNASGGKGWDVGLSFGAYDGYNPITPTGTLIGTFPHAGTTALGTVANGIDFSAYTFTGNFLKSINFTVDGKGNATANTVKATSALIGVSVSPGVSNSACTPGQIQNDQNYIYICIATNHWKRALLTSF